MNSLTLRQWSVALLTLFLVAAVGVSAVVYWKYRQRNLLAQAYQAYEGADPGKTLKFAGEVLFLEKNNEEALRLRALVLRKDKPEEALDIFGKLLLDKESPFQVQNAKDYVGLCLQLNRYDDAKKVLQDLFTKLPNDPDVLVYHARMLVKDGLVKEASTEVENALNINKEHPGGNLLSGQLLLSNPEAISSIQAKARLRTAGNSDTMEGLVALLEWGTQPNLELFPEDREWLIKRLNTHPWRDTSCLLLAGSHEMTLHSDQKPQIIQKYYDQLKGTANERLLVAWLVTVGANDKALTLIDEAAALKDSNLYDARLQALLKSGKREEAEKLVSAEVDFVSPMQRATMLSMMQDPAADPAELKRRWAKAYELAKSGGGLEQLMGLGRAAATRRDWPEAIKAYSTVWTAGVDQAKNFQLGLEYFSALQSAGETEQALQVAKQMAAAHPGNPIALNNYAYVLAILNLPLDPVEADFDAVLNKSSHPTLVSTKAMMLWRQGKFKEAWAIYKTIAPEYLRRPSTMLLGIILLKSLGANEQVAILRQKLDVPELGPAERVLMEQVLGR